MSRPDIHPDITIYKTFDEITASAEEFRKLVGMLLLFARESDYYEYSGWCRGAVLNAPKCPECGETGSMIAFSKGPEATKPEDMAILRLNRNELKTMLGHCDAFIGQTPDESFFMI